jgi:hypothetical protein
MWEIPSPTGWFGIRGGRTFSATMTTELVRCESAASSTLLTGSWGDEGGGGAAGDVEIVG